jgi:hypothetical protein
MQHVALVARSALVAVCWLLLLGHVCVLPGHVDAELGHGTAADAPDRAEAWHARTCDVDRAAPPPSLPALAGAATRTPDLILAGSATSPVRAVVPRAASPPLFLRHASLLI